MKKTSIKLSDETVEMAEPTVRVLKNAMDKGNEISQAIYMIATLTNKTEADIEDMNLKDHGLLQKALQDFLEEAGVMA